MTLDSITPLSINGENEGSLTVGTISAYSPVCSTLENGVGTLRDKFRTFFQ